MDPTARNFLPSAKVFLLRGAGLWARAGLILCLGFWTGACARQTPEAAPALAEITFNLAFKGDPESPKSVELVASCSRPWQEILGDAEIDWKSVLTFHRVPEGEMTDAWKDSPAIVGEYSVRGRELYFRPAVPPIAGVPYVARLNPGALPLPALPAREPLRVFAKFGIENESEGKPVEIAAIYPSGDRLPANHLKFYLVFSEPMHRGDIFKHFRIERSDGSDVPEPFRETQLWSEDGTRLTLWLHPGRQKAGVNLNLEIGPVLEEGGEYRLVISGDYESQRGRALGREYQKTFQAVATDRTQPDLADWIVKVPRAGTSESLQIEFPEPYDWALLRSRVWIEDLEGKRVPGKISIGPAERSWSFRPGNAWVALAGYRIAVASVLEDLAGNSLARPFEADVNAAEAAVIPSILYLPFETIAGE